MSQPISHIGLDQESKAASQTRNSLGDVHKHDDPRSCVLLSRLTPRDVTLAEPDSQNVFAERYVQLERILAGAQALRKQQDMPELKIVCIDSLNVFGDGLLNREQIYRLFDLLQRHAIIGVFVVEEDESQADGGESGLHRETIEYLADVVLALSAEEDAGYFVRYFEITKSRYQHQVYGKHPFKIVKSKEQSRDRHSDLDKDKQERGKPDPEMPVPGIVVYPSLHYIVYGTERREKAKVL